MIFENLGEDPKKEVAKTEQKQDGYTDNIQRRGLKQSNPPAQARSTVSFKPEASENVYSSLTTG